MQGSQRKEKTGDGQQAKYSQYSGHERIREVVARWLGEGPLRGCQTHVFIITLASWIGFFFAIPRADLRLRVVFVVFLLQAADAIEIKGIETVRGVTLVGRKLVLVDGFETDAVLSHTHHNDAS